MAGTLYSTLVQVAQDAKVAVFSAATTPTDTKANEIIAEEGAAIDVKLGLKYVLPLVQPASLLRIRKIHLAFCAERIRDIMDIKSGTPELNQGGRPPMTAADRARADLKAIVSGTEALQGETLLTSGDGVKFNQPSIPNGPPIFKRGVQQW